MEIKSLTEAVDMFPTILELAGIPKKADDGFPLQGKSLVPSLTRGLPTGTEFVVGENWDSISVFTEDYKMTKWYQGDDLHPEESHDYSDNDGLLFDRQYDEGEGPSFPLETENLYGRKEYKEVQRDLESKLEQWIETTSSIGRDEKFLDTT